MNDRVRCARKNCRSTRVLFTGTNGNTDWYLCRACRFFEHYSSSPALSAGFWPFPIIQDTPAGRAEYAFTAITVALFADGEFDGHRRGALRVFRRLEPGRQGIQPEVVVMLRALTIGSIIQILAAIALIVGSVLVSNLPGVPRALCLLTALNGAVMLLDAMFWIAKVIFGAVK